jgi:hypothetical protein
MHPTDDEIDRVDVLLTVRLDSIRSVRHEHFGERIVLIDSSVRDFGMTSPWEWHERDQVPMLLVFQPKPSGRRVLTACCRNRETADQLFGPRGMLDLLPRLKPPGRGGRPMTWSHAREAARCAARAAVSGSS